MDYKEAVRYGILMGVVFALFDGGLIYDVVVSCGNWSMIWKSALVVIDTVVAVLYFKSAVSAYKKNKELIEKLQTINEAVRDCRNGKLTVNEAREKIGLKRIEGERTSDYE